MRQQNPEIQISPRQMLCDNHMLSVRHEDRTKSATCGGRQVSPTQVKVVPSQVQVQGIPSGEQAPFPQE